jgi:hypothetical protein
MNIMTSNTKSLIRHALTAIGTVIALLGINAWVPIIDFLKDNLEPIWDSVTVLIGFVVTLYGFFVNRDKEEAEETE